MLRRSFLTTATMASLATAKSPLSHKERVDLALQGKEVDRTPFSFWHHFGLKTPESHAKATLDFHRAYRTDIVKVMSDFPYPKPTGKWYELKPLDNPFPQQIQALEMIRDGLKGSAYFIETIFNPYNVAQKLSSKEEVARLKKENPQALLNALDVITQSEIRHAKRVLALGASGVLLSVANANKAELSPADYKKFSEPFDRRLTEAVKGSPLTFLHIHVEPVYLEFFRDFPAPVVNYSHRVSGIPIATVRKSFSNVIAGGIDEVDYAKLTPAQLKEQWQAAMKAAGRKYILTPGCSVPDQSTKEELNKLPGVLNA
ncbi:MAG: hypothetical protein HY820_37250 [Acidobacteria bacterium]|nr:hypothetical protein [Acidobacteriota bacterium]